MTGWLNAGMVVAATVSVLGYMELNFAKASEFDQLKELMVAEGIQRRMWIWCREPQRDDLKARIELERVRFAQAFGHNIDWPCVP